MNKPKKGAPKKDFPCVTTSFRVLESKRDKFRKRVNKFLKEFQK